MGTLLKILQIALIGHKTIVAVGASVVIAVSVYEHLRKTRK